MPQPSALLPGTLDLLILKALSLGQTHGYGVLLRVQEITGGGLTVEQGALYPALYRLERQGFIDASWGVSDNNRRARFYRITVTGRRKLKDATTEWNRIVAVMAGALGRSR